MSTTLPQDRIADKDQGDLPAAKSLEVFDLPPRSTSEQGREVAALVQHPDNFHVALRHPEKDHMRVISAERRPGSRS
ncbi:MAG: hypothetical protein JOY78_10705 [Pseudonocardia sp.]|nr:hypothetical protein [Pseudonocardia sp.]